MQNKILIDAERLRYSNSGIATVCRALIKGFSELPHSSQLTIYAAPASITDLPASSILHWRPWHRFLPPNYAQFSLVHVTHQLSSHFHLSRQKQKKIVTLHDLNFLHDHSSERKKAKSTALVQKNIGDADAIVFISNFARDDFNSNRHLFNLKKGVIEKVIHNGLIFPASWEFKSEKLAHLLEQPFILNIGVLFPKKNQKVLLPLLVGNHKQFVIVASDAKAEYKSEFLQEAARLGVSDRIVLLENISENDKYFLLQHCEALCHPSLAEGFGIPPIEAMYFAKPVFLSTKTSLPEIGGDAAFYLENFSADEVVQTYKRGLSVYHSDGHFPEKVKGHAQKYSYIRMAQKYASLYDEVLNAT